MSTRRLLVLFGYPGRGGFNEAAVRGAERASLAGHELELHWVSSPDRAAHLRALCESAPDLIVVHGGQGDAPVADVAADFPQVQFAITQGSHVAPNVAAYEILQEHSAFLAGILAGLRAAERGEAAHLSGERVRPGLKGRAAYADGVRRITGRDPLTGFCGNQHDEVLAQSWTEALIAQEARVVFAMMDGGRDGVSAACRQAGIWQIGNVLDWVARDPEVYLASALADSGLCVERAVADHAEGRLATGQIVRIGLEAPQALRLVPGKDVSASERAIIDGWAGRLHQGSIEVAHDYSGAEFALQPALI